MENDLLRLQNAKKNSGGGGEGHAPSLLPLNEHTNNNLLTMALLISYVYTLRFVLYDSYSGVLK